MKSILKITGLIILFILGCSKDDEPTSNNTGNKKPVFTPTPLDSFCIINNDTYYYENKCPYSYSLDTIKGEYKLREFVFIDSCKSVNKDSVIAWDRAYWFKVLERDSFDSISMKKVNVIGRNSINSQKGNISLNKPNLRVSIDNTTDVGEDHWDELYNKCLNEDSRIYDKGRYFYKYYGNAILKFEKL